MDELFFFECDGDTHEIVITEDGHLVPINHPNVIEEAALAEIGGESADCVTLYQTWNENPIDGWVEIIKYSAIMPLYAANVLEQYVSQWKHFVRSDDHDYMKPFNAIKTVRRILRTISVYSSDGRKQIGGAINTYATESIRNYASVADKEKGSLLYATYHMLATLDCHLRDTIKDEDVLFSSFLRDIYFYDQGLMDEEYQWQDRIVELEMFMNIFPKLVKAYEKTLMEQR